jgi:hypothetical protein
MSVDNLIPYWGARGGAVFGIHFEYNNFIRHGNGFHKSTQIQENGSCWITRNGEKFYEVSGRSHEYALAKAQSLIVDLSESFFSVFSRNWKEEIKGRKVWHHNQPAKVKYICEGQGAMILEPDGIDKFEPQIWQIDEDQDRQEWMAEYGDSVKVDMLSESVHWFRK